MIRRESLFYDEFETWTDKEKLNFYIHSIDEYLYQISIASTRCYSYRPKTWNEANIKELVLKLCSSNYVGDDFVALVSEAYELKNKMIATNRRLKFATSNAKTQMLIKKAIVIHNELAEYITNYYRELFCLK